MSFTKQFLRTRYLVLTIALILLLAMPSWKAHAHIEPEQNAISSEQLSPQENGASDPEANLPALFAVYTITWAGFFAFAFLMSKRQKEMRREIDVLKTVLKEQGRHTENE